MAEENKTPVAGAEPPPASPIAPHASTLKLKPVIRKPTIGGAVGARPGLKPGLKLPAMAPAATPAPAASAPVHASAEGGAMEQLKTVTQKLKGVTQQIPQQAILHKTGIIADQDLTAAQIQAAKSRTARISLSDAMGVAPVKNEAAPMKTIRIKRPDSIARPAPAAVPQQESAAAEEPETAPTTADKPTLTQRKTLKISRPGAVKPGGKFGIKKPGAKAPEPAPASDGGEVANIPDVADIPDIPDLPAGQPKFAPAPVPADAIPDVSKGCNIASIIFQLAACVVIGFLGYYLYQDAQLPLYAGGCGWGQ